MKKDELIKQLNLVTIKINELDKENVRLREALEGSERCMREQVLKEIRDLQSIIYALITKQNPEIECKKLSKSIM